MIHQNLLFRIVRIKAIVPYAQIHQKLNKITQKIIKYLMLKK